MVISGTLSSIEVYVSDDKISRVYKVRKTIEYNSSQILENS